MTLDPKPNADILAEKGQNLPAHVEHAPQESGHEGITGDSSDEKHPNKATDSDDVASLGREAAGGLEAPDFIKGLTPEERQDLERRLKRKIDTRLLPAVIVMYILNYIDRNNIAAAKLAGLEKDLGLSSVEYSTAVSILFVGYV